ncbi:MAG TPA: zinc metalloprotease HtpX [Spirochaetia bacterium]|nr:zinc metalloprotease HtpX [Spirochaetia bacterium]
MKDLLLREKLQRIIQTTVIGAGMLALLLWTGQLILGTTGLVLFGAAGLLFIFLSGRRSGSLLFAQATHLEPADAPDLYRMVRELSLQAGLPAAPRIAYIPTPAKNALTVGDRRDSLIIVTYGLLSTLSSKELEGVIAHEISHIRSNDMWLFSAAQYVRSATDFISRFGWILLLFTLPIFLLTGASLSLTAVAAMVASPLLSLVLQLALLRTREFSADLGAAELTGDPSALASALRKVDPPRRTLFDYLVGYSQSRQSALLRTHPATEERIRRLSALGGRKSAETLPPRVSGYRY